jgi:hypothetical protein
MGNSKKVLVTYVLDYCRRTTHLSLIFKESMVPRAQGYDEAPE